MTINERQEEIKKFVLEFNETLGRKENKVGRIYELKTFADEFNEKLQNAYKKYNKVKN
jgi:uncharacterized coiled-coil DUF342 family protein